MSDLEAVSECAEGSEREEVLSRIALTEEEIQKAEKDYNIHKVLYDKVK